MVANTTVHLRTTASFFNLAAAIRAYMYTNPLLFQGFFDFIVQSSLTITLTMPNHLTLDTCIFLTFRTPNFISLSLILLQHLFTIRCRTEEQVIILSHFRIDTELLIFLEAAIVDHALDFVLCWLSVATILGAAELGMFHLVFYH